MGIILADRHKLPLYPFVRGGSEQLVLAYGRLIVDGLLPTFSYAGTRDILIRGLALSSVICDSRIEGIPDYFTRCDPDFPGPVGPVYFHKRGRECRMQPLHWRQRGMKISRCGLSQGVGFSEFAKALKKYNKECKNANSART